MSGYSEKEYNNPFSLKSWAKLIPFIKPYTKYLILTVFFMLVTAGVDIVLPLMQMYAIDNFIAKNTVENLGIYMAVAVLLVVLQTLGVVIFVRFAMKIEMKLGKDLKRAQFTHLQKLSFSYYNTTPVGYIMARVMSDTLRIATMISWGLTDLLWAFSYVVGVFIAMLMINFQLALIVITVIPFISIVTFFFQKKILKYNRRVRKINSQITGAFNEGILGTKTSKTLVIEEENHKSFSEITQTMYKASIRASMLNSLFIPIVLSLSSCSVALVLFQGGHLAYEQMIEIGTLSVFVSYAMGIFEPIQQIARIIADIISTQANIERVTDLIEHKQGILDTPEVVEKYGDNFEGKRENWEDIKGDIEFVNVDFKYPDGTEYILKNFNLKIPAGTTIAIVGQTGAGKSTLVNLACRFFEPTAGEILIDGVDYKKRSQLWLHSNIGYVLQTPHLFSGTVRENIKYGKLDATNEEIENAAKNVRADHVVEKLKDGYDSYVGESGDMLSTGEKQLISFARAIIANPAIFVLDEATASIDTQTEKLIQQAIDYLLTDRTSFVIAHRLSTIKHADLILVVEEGKIIERGTHEELLNQKGHYFELYNNQFEEEAQARILHKEKSVDQRY